MPRSTPLLVLLLLAAPAIAQDMPLSQVLLDGESWRPVADSKSLPPGIVDMQVKGKRVGGLAPTNSFVYYTVPDEKAVYYALRSEEKPRKVAEGIARPTGVALSPEGGTLVVADAAGNHLYAFRVEKDGSLTCQEPYYTMRLPNGKKASGAAECASTAPVGFMSPARSACNASIRRVVSMAYS